VGWSSSMAGEEIIASFEELWSALSSQSLDFLSSEGPVVDVTIFIQLEQRLCNGSSREYRNYVNFFKNQLQNRSSLAVFVGSLTAISLVHQYPQITPSLNYLLLAVKELHLPPPIIEEASMVLIFPSFILHSHHTLFFSLSFSLSLSLSIYLSIYLCLSFSLSIYLSISLSLYLLQFYISSLLSLLLVNKLEQPDTDARGFMKLVLRCLDLFPCSESLSLSQETLALIFHRLTTYALWSAITR
jgi:hypothetical protein